MASARKALHGREDLGWVVMLRDRTELQQLTRQLDAVGTLSTALRAQRHEFANQLHTIAGFMSIGQHQQARDYLARLAATGPLKFPVDQAELLQDPYLQAFLGAKGVEADERGVSPAARPRNPGPRPGHRAAGRHHRAGQPDRQRRERRRRRVRRRTAGWRWRCWTAPDADGAAGTLHIVVADSGDGLPGPTAGPMPARTRSSPRDSPPLGARSARAPATGWGSPWPGSWRAAAAGTSRCWTAARPGGPGAVFLATLPRRPRRRMRRPDTNPEGGDNDV